MCVLMQKMWWDYSVKMISCGPNWDVEFVKMISFGVSFVHTQLQLVDWFGVINII